jgi:hypothetical protein
MKKKKVLFFCKHNAIRDELEVKLTNWLREQEERP